MKETKVYVDVEPRKIATQLVDLENEQFNCVILMFDTDVKPIEVIVEPKFKDHDRELVKEVCEKIKEHLSEQKKSLKDTFSPYSNGKAFIISAVEESLNKIEKEFEK